MGDQRWHRRRALFGWLGSVGVLGAVLAVVLVGVRTSPEHRSRPAALTQAPPVPAVEGDRAGADVTPRTEPHASPSTQPARPPDAAPGSRLVFHDTFPDSTLQPGKWIKCFPWMPTGCTNPNNHELQWNTPSQATVSHGTLRLTAERRPITGTDVHGNPKTFAYRSALVATADRFTFTYGYVQFRARFPIGTGLWPAVWLLPADQKPLPEMDVLEAANRSPGTVHHFFHSEKGLVNGVAIPNVTGWHTYGLSWTPTSLSYFIDGVKQFAVSTDIPNKPMYLLASLAVGGDWPGGPDASTPFPSRLEIQDVQIWQ